MNIQEAAAASVVSQGAASGLPPVADLGFQGSAQLIERCARVFSQLHSLAPIA